MKHTTPVIHQMNSLKTTQVPLITLFIVLVIASLGGMLIGFGLSKATSKKTPTGEVKKVQTETSAGISDKKTFKDSSEGMLREGGIDGEGNFHLERPGGKSQNVYLTSSTVDLSLYLNKKVRVHGETFNAQKAGWLMDVGLVEILP